MEVCSTSEVIQMDSFLLVRISSQPRTHTTCNGSPAYLHGTDVGEPPRWTFLADPRSPYYIEEDTFYDINKTIATVTRIKSIHNCKTNHALPLSSFPFPFRDRTILQLIDTTISQHRTCL